MKSVSVTPPRRFSYDRGYETRTEEQAPITTISLPPEFKQELRIHYEAKESFKMQLEAEQDARNFAESQLKETLERLQNSYKKIDQLEDELLNLRDKYKRLKMKRGREEPREQHNPFNKELEDKFQEQRKVFIKEQQLLKENIKNLELQLSSHDAVKQQEIRVLNKQKDMEIKKIKNGQDKLHAEIRALMATKIALEKQLSLAYEQSEEKSKKLLFLQNRLEQFQIDNLHTQQNIIAIEQEIDRLKAQNYRLRNTIKKNQEIFQDTLARQAQDHRKRFGQLFEEVEELRAANRLRVNELRQVKFGEPHRTGMIKVRLTDTEIK